MRLLDRYLLRELMIPLGYCLGGFLIFWITYELFTDLNSLQRYRLTTGDICEYYLARAPEMLVTVIPLALLLALLYSLTNHARYHEITAMRAAGRSLWRIAIPYFAVAMAAVGSLYALNELAVPDGADTTEQILKRRLPDDTRGVGRKWQRGLTFVNQADGRTWFIGAYNTEAYDMFKLHIEWLLPDGSRRQISAERGIRTNETWLFLDVEEVTIPAGNAVPSAPIKMESLVLPELTETPRLIQSEIKVNRLASIKTAKRTFLSSQEILDYLRLHPNLDTGRRDQLLTTLHSRLAMPWTCLVVVLIALPFGAASGRRNVFVGVASSVFICFVYFVLREMSLAMGNGGRVDPWLAAWVPNIVFGLTGVILTQKTR